MADRLNHDITKLINLNNISKGLGLKFTFSPNPYTTIITNIQIMTNLVIGNGYYIEEARIAETTSYKYLDNEIRINRDNQTR